MNPIPAHTRVARGGLTISRLVVVVILVMFAAGVAAGIAASRIMAPWPEAAPTAPAAPSADAPAAQPATPPEPPPARVSVSTATVAQGDALLVTVDGVGGADRVQVVVTAPGGASQAHEAFIADGAARVVIPVGVASAPGAYGVGAVLEDADVIPASFTVEKKTFPSSRITVDEETARLTQDQARITADQEKVRFARSTTYSALPWRQGFDLPLKAAVGTPFGFARYVNGVESGRHWGVDFAAPAGTPVRAANDGRVVLAEALLLSGNTIIIDHGLNVFTSYLHLSRIEVRTGDTVKKGDVIGRVGSTGFSTGPHLHWSANVGQSSINPMALPGL